MQKNIEPLKKFKVTIDAATLSKLNNEINEESCTIVHCTYIASDKYVNGGWVNIFPTTILEPNDNSFQQLPLLHAINIPVAPKKHYFKNKGDVLRFTLYFPAIPANWKTFSLIEIIDSGGIGLSASAILRNNTGVYNVIMK